MNVGGVQTTTAIAIGLQVLGDASLSSRLLISMMVRRDDPPNKPQQPWNMDATVTNGGGLVEDCQEIKTARKSARTPSFVSLQDLLVHYGRNAPDRRAIAAPGRSPMAYGALLLQTRDVVRGLRSLDVGRTDRVAVVLPDGPEATVAMVAAAGAVCVPLSPGFTYDEYEPYFGELHLAALLTDADPTSASRRAGASHFWSGAAASPDDEFASSADDAFILLTSGAGAFNIVGQVPRRAPDARRVGWPRFG